MSFQGINFSSQHIVPSDDGRLYEAIFEDGALHGCELSYVGAALTIGAGYLMIGGREIEITEDEVFNVNEATSGYAQLVLTIDLTQTATTGAFNQVSIDVRYASTEAGFASLIQDDINGAGTKYQQQLALVSLGTGGITGIVAGMPSASLKGAGRVFSIIAVIYPAGSTCTCSDGTITLTARDTSGTALFNVPSAGTWTVSCTDGTNTASHTVTITAAGQVENVLLHYKLYLYKNGDEYTNITGGWVYRYDDEGSTLLKKATITKGDDGLTLSTNGYEQGYLSTANLIDLSDIDTIKFSVSDVTALDRDGTLCQVVICPSNYTWLYTPSNYAAIHSLSTGDNGIYGIDVRKLTGSYYIALHIAASYSGTNKFTVSEVRGE